MNGITVDSLESMLLIALKSNPEISKEIVRQQVLLFSAPAGITDPGIQDELCRRLESKLSIRLEMGHVICEPYEPWLDSRKAEIEPFFWNRYAQLLEEKAYPPNVIAKLNQITDQLLGLLENPKRDGEWNRRGLVVGHVQSGKTANYIGLMNKAADAGYKLIILIAGTLNNLRRQTQIRVDEGFVGRDSSLILRSTAKREDKFVGVGHKDQRRFPIVFTSTNQDFSIKTAQSLGLSVNAVSEPIVLVIKKNLNTLKNLTEWLQNHNTKGGSKVIDDVPMLLIDDEADYASIDTSASGADPTKINSQIRQLLHSFSKRCYLGYTATPYANVFINHETAAEMLGEDLFPRDFIVSLEAPTNYIGPDELFGDPPVVDAIRSVDDFGEVLPLKHKITTEVGNLPASLLGAIRAFVLVRATRLCRGQGGTHNSMLINVSRFTLIQQQVCTLVDAYLTQLRNSIRFNYKLDWSQAGRNGDMTSLKTTWDTEFAQASVEWTDVLARLNDAIAPIVTVEVNSSRGAAQLNYEANAKMGLNVIAVGGLSLSRGLTLEGLSVSYVLRNSQMYDTLLQMGRWFGYRDGYRDLTRVYLPDEAIDWYAHITLATSELRMEFERMESLRMTPRDFGLKVRSDPDTLLITARNKMREAKEILWDVGLAGELIETTKLVARQDALDSNWSAVLSLIERMNAHSVPAQDSPGEQVLWRGVPREYVLSFLKTFRTHPANVVAQAEPITSYCTNPDVPNMEVWDVVLASSSLANAPTLILGGHQIGAQVRKIETENLMPPALLVSGKSARVASRGLEKTGVDPAVASNADQAFRNNHPGKKNVPDWVYREVRERPLLMLHAISAREGGPSFDRIAGWGISFPGEKGHGVRKLVSYKVNLVWWNEQHGDLLQEQGSDDDEN